MTGEAQKIWNVLEGAHTWEKVEFSAANFYTSEVFDVVQEYAESLERSVPFSELGKLAGRIENSSRIKSLVNSRT